MFHISVMVLCTSGLPSDSWLSAVQNGITSFGFALLCFLSIGFILLSNVDEGMVLTGEFGGWLWIP